MRKSLLLATAATGAVLSLPACACDPVPGMLIGGGIGAAIGNAPGAAVGAILGSAITGSAPCYGRYGDRYYYDRPYAESRYYDRGHYEPAPVYYAPRPRVYYEPAAVYAPPPVYYAPAAYGYYPAYPVYVSYGRPYYRSHSRRHWHR